MTFKPPIFMGTAYNCPYCLAYARVDWGQLYFRTRMGGMQQSAYFQAVCEHCKKSSCWLGLEQTEDARYKAGRMVEPVVCSAPPPHPDMPEDAASDYREAMSVSPHSPRAAAALLRLAIQRLCKYLGEPGKNINDDIGNLVKKGLPAQIQQALDIVRVVGNNAVHPGAIADSDVSAVTSSLFDLVNYIVEDQIARPKQIASMFSSLPAPALSGIAIRDKGAKSNESGT